MDLETDRSLAEEPVADGGERGINELYTDKVEGIAEAEAGVDVTVAEMIAVSGTGLVACAKKEIAELGTIGRWTSGAAARRNLGLKAVQLGIRRKREQVFLSRRVRGLRGKLDADNPHRQENPQGSQ